MASSKVCLVSALCSFIIFTICISSTESVSCCMRYSKHPPPLKKILGYNIQTITGSCDISAIVFQLPGRFVCADPSTDWTQKALKIIDVRRRKVNQILKGKH
ncbi:C-C motif chemokine 20b [Nematolebias whitei]|uniref:C-C motif chemokine 20b n=1 Tax=Nematolebias whitei TaxID=451745 RepID=UPI00189A3487|nr:C-C motif chemokine 20b [Nematolebias whitei]